MAQKREVRIREDFLRELRGKAAEMRLNDRLLAEAADISPSTFCRRKKDPDGLTVAQLRRIITVLEPDKDVVLALIGYREAREPT